METPTIAKSMGYASSSIDPAAFFLQAERRMSTGGSPAAAAALQQFQQNQGIKMAYTSRIVKVFIADPNDNLPLDKRVLYSGDEKLTDLTDQELFFDVPITSLLTAHNAVRAKTVDKKATEKFGREIFLEPARIRDLKMVVVDIAQF